DRSVANIFGLSRLLALRGVSLPRCIGRFWSKATSTQAGRRSGFMSTRPALVQARALEESPAIGGSHAQLHGAPVAIDHQRNFNAGGAERPDAAEQAGKIAHLGAAHR